jgi:hypothetical protein
MSCDRCGVKATDATGMARLAAWVAMGGDISQILSLPPLDAIDVLAALLNATVEDATRLKETRERLNPHKVPLREADITDFSPFDEDAMAHYLAGRRRREDGDHYWRNCIFSFDPKLSQSDVFEKFRNAQRIVGEALDEAHKIKAECDRACELNDAMFESVMRQIRPAGLGRYYRYWYQKKAGSDTWHYEDKPEPWTKAWLKYTEKPDLDDCADFSLDIEEVVAKEFQEAYDAWAERRIVKLANMVYHKKQDDRPLDTLLGLPVDELERIAHWGISPKPQPLSPTRDDGSASPLPIEKPLPPSPPPTQTEDLPPHIQALRSVGIKPPSRIHIDLNRVREEHTAKLTQEADTEIRRLPSPDFADAPPFLRTSPVAIYPDKYKRMGIREDRAWAESVTLGLNSDVVKQIFTECPDNSLASERMRLRTEAEAYIKGQVDLATRTNAENRVRGERVIALLAQTLGVGKEETKARLSSFYQSPLLRDDTDRVLLRIDELYSWEVKQRNERRVAKGK